MINIQSCTKHHILFPTGAALNKIGEFLTMIILCHENELTVFPGIANSSPWAISPSSPTPSLPPHYTDYVHSFHNPSSWLTSPPTLSLMHAVFWFSWENWYSITLWTLCLYAISPRAQHTLMETARRRKEGHRPRAGGRRDTDHGQEGGTPTTGRTGSARSALPYILGSHHPQQYPFNSFSSNHEKETSELETEDCAGL